MERRKVQSAAVVVALAVMAMVLAVAPTSAHAAASPGPGVDAAVDYTVTLDGEYPPRWPFGEEGATLPWGGWDHVFTADWHQGSWTVSYGGLTLAAYCIQVNNFRHPADTGGSIDFDVWNGSERTLVKASYVLWRWGSTSDPLRAMAVSMLLHFYQSPTERSVSLGVPVPDINGNGVFDETITFASAAYASVPGMLTQMDGAANAWGAAFGFSRANVEAGVIGVRGGVLASLATGQELTPGMVDDRGDGYLYTAGMAQPLNSPGQEQNVLVAGSELRGVWLPAVSADVHLRKSVSDDGSTWVNAQSGAPLAYEPAADPATPWLGSFDDGGPDSGDGVPVYRVGADVSFKYEVWLDAGSIEGVVSWPGAPLGVVTDDNGTPDDGSDDWQPAYSGGDDGDGFLEPDEVWVYQAVDQRTTRAGQSYRNYSSIPAGVVYDTLERVTPEGASSARRDPAGFEVVWVNSTTATSAADGSHVLLPGGGVINDEVCYGGVIPGVALTVQGEIVSVASDGTWKALDPAVDGSAKFTPDGRTGCVQVDFWMPADVPGNYAVFETLKAGSTTLGWHRSAEDARQSFRQLRRIEVGSTACHVSVTAAKVTGVASTCDVVALTGGPEDAGLVVSGTVQAFPLAQDGSRICSDPGPVVEWSVTLDELGEGTVRTPEVTLEPGRWEWIEWGSLPDGRESGRTCESDDQVSAEMFGVLPAGQDPSGGITTTGSNAIAPLGWGSVLVSLGAALLVVARRVRRAMTPVEVAG